MAEIIVCDGCGVQSPDSRGRHIANDWQKVTVDNQRDTILPPRFIFCGDCLPKPTKAKAVRDILRRWFRPAGNLET